VLLRTLGCKVNRAESEALAQSLGPLGIIVTGDIGVDRPEAVVVNTCTVTGEADAKARKEIRRALSLTAGPVIVTGCLAVLDSRGLRALGDRVVVHADRGSVAATVAGLLRVVPVARPGSAWEVSRAPGVPVRGPAFRTRALVKVQDGCDNRCAYCIVPDARGLPQSIACDDVCRRVAALHGAGVAEVVLTGVNLGRYEGGAGAPDLASLVERIAATGIRRIRLSSIEPPDLTPRLLEVLARTPAAAPHLHVPLQSGCDRTLAAMGRRYDPACFADAIARARAALPGLSVTTDVIAGFPGETDDDFIESLAFVEERGFGKLHVFRYSRRAGTVAATAPGQVADTVKASRAHAFRDLGSALERAHALARAGERALMLVETIRDGVARGTTEDYLRIVAELPGARHGDLVPVTLEVSSDGTARGYYVEEPSARG
jgi:threonylcarbamoyladenosine tRNA methylthiotransferase MtaB